MASTTRGIKSIEVGGRILAELIHASGPMMLKDLAAGADLTSAQTHAYLTSYRAGGLVEQDQHTGLYRIGPFALPLGSGRIRQMPCLSETRSTVDQLAAELGLMVAMVVLGPYGPTVVYIQQGDNPLGINIRPGTLFSVVGTASGRVFSALSNEAKVQQLIDSEFANRHQLTLSDDITPNEFAKQLKKIRKRQYDYAEGSPIPSINALAAPIFSSPSELAAVITLIGHEDEFTVDNESTEIVQRFLQGARVQSYQNQ